MQPYLSKIVLIKNDDSIEAVRDQTEELIDAASSLGFTVIGGYTKRQPDNFETVGYGEGELVKATPQGILAPSHATSKNAPGRK